MMSLLATIRAYLPRIRRRAPGRRGRPVNLHGLTATLRDIYPAAKLEAVLMRPSGFAAWMPEPGRMDVPTDLGTAACPSRTIARDCAEVDLWPDVYAARRAAEPWRWGLHAGPSDWRDIDEPTLAGLLEMAERHERERTEALERIP